MPFSDVCKELAPEVVAALKVLDASGFQIFTDVRIEDCVKPDGNRRRTFSNRGRYAVGALLKNVGSRDGQELKAFPADSFTVQPAVEIQGATAEPVAAIADPEPQPEEPQEPDNDSEKRRPGRPRRR